MINKKYLTLLDKQDSLSLYIHIPFCNTKCSYCAFYSESKNNWNDNKINLYINKLNRELDIIKSYYNRPFDTVFIGGGNPGVLSFNQLRNLLIKIGPSKETSFEINPETLREKHISLIKEGLATRISVGIQSFNDNILNLLKRNARKVDNLRALKIISELDNIEIDFDNNYFIKNDIISKENYRKLNTKIKYSFDLMTSLPTQTLDDCINDIKLLLNNTKLEHLSLYCLSIEEGTQLFNLVHDHKINKNNDIFEKNLLENIWNYLENIGFDHYEVSNFSKGDNKCLHNLNYWSLSSYISLGSSSASSIYDDKTLIRLTNISNINKYLNHDLLDDYEIEELTKYEHLDEYLIVTLRNKRGISYKYMKKYFDIDKNVLNDAFSRLNSDTYIVNNDTINLTREGFILLDTLVLDLSIYLENFLTK